MPIYDFKCKSCGETITIIQKITETTQEIPCTHCTGTAKKELNSSQKFQFKGVDFCGNTKKNFA